MSTALSLLFTNKIANPLALVDQTITGATWAAAPPNELVNGTTGGGFGVGSTNSAFSCSFTYTPDGTHKLGVEISVSEGGGIKIVPSQSPPYSVAESPQKQGDTWVVTLIYTGS